MTNTTIEDKFLAIAEVTLEDFKDRHPRLSRAINEIRKDFTEIVILRLKKDSRYQKLLDEAKREKDISIVLSQVSPFVLTFVKEVLPQIL